MPGVAKVQHRGRRSGTPYETVVTPFRKGATLAIVLGHGKTDWVKNVLAANEADVAFGSRTVHIVNPRIVPAGGGGGGAPPLARGSAVGTRRVYRSGPGFRRGKWECSSPTSRDTLIRVATEVWLTFVGAAIAIAVSPGAAA